MAVCAFDYDPSSMIIKSTPCCLAMAGAHQQCVWSSCPEPKAHIRAALIAYRSSRLWSFPAMQEELSGPRLQKLGALSRASRVVLRYSLFVPVGVVKASRPSNGSMLVLCARCSAECCSGPWTLAMLGLHTAVWHIKQGCLMKLGLVASALNHSFWEWRCFFRCFGLLGLEPSWPEVEQPRLLGPTEQALLFLVQCRY